MDREDLTLERELALRLLTSQFRPAAGARRDAASTARVLDDLSQAHLPADIPIIPDLDFVGGVVWPEQITLLFRTTAQAQEVYDSLIRELDSFGWNYQPFGASEGGFPLVHEPSSSRSFFCHNTLHSHLTVDILALGDGSTDVEMEISTDLNDRRCQEDDAWEKDFPPRDEYLRLPTCMPPHGAAQASVQAGGDPVHAHAAAEVWTDLDVSTVHDHYARHLVVAGWEPAEESISDTSAWSTFGHEGEDGIRYQAFFSTVHDAASGSYLLDVWTGRTKLLTQLEMGGWHTWFSS